MLPRVLGGRYFVGVEIADLPAIGAREAARVEAVIGPMPLLPRATAAQAVGQVLPTGETMPRPVTTTRRLLKASTSGWLADRP